MAPSFERRCDSTVLTLDRLRIVSLTMDLNASGSVAAVVVHYRTPERLAACLAALMRQTSRCQEIVVIDNSPPADALKPPTRDEHWRVHHAPRNLGFGAACNLGARMTQSDYVIFLNADLVLSDTACESMRTLADENSAVAAIGPRIWDAQGEIELSARSFPSLRTGILGRSSVATRALRRTAGAPPRQVSAALSARSRTVDWVSGACMLIRRRAFEQVGGFDEGYWMYWEDADLCRRLRRQEWDVMLCVDAHARHSTGASGKSQRTIEAFHLSAARYYEQHVARTALTAKLARVALRARMKFMLNRHVRRSGREAIVASSGAGAGHRVLIDALAARFGGTAYATVHLARHLAQQPDVFAALVVTRRGSIVARELADDPAVRCIELRPAARADLLRRTLWQAVWLRNLVERERCDAVISMSGILPRPPGPRVICLLGNSVMYETDGLANRLRRRAVRRTARDAAYLVAPSRSMAELVSASTGRPCDVAPLGVDRSIFSPAAVAGHEILCVADFYAHKRHDLLLDAWLALPAPRPHLRLVGDPAVDPDTHRQLLARIANLPEGQSILFDYHVAHGRMVDIYRRARIFVLPSQHESFCMPVAESMACGVPAVVRSLPSLRETGGVGARYVEGDDPAVWAGVVRELIDDDSRYQHAREEAISAGARYSWTALAQRIVSRM